MYENTNSSIDWKGIFLKVIIAFLVIAIAFTGIKTFTKGKVNKKPVTTNVVESNSSTTFTANIEKLREVGEKYYKDNTDKLPKDDITSMVTLNELIASGAITSLTDADGKVCDGESSYVTAVKTGDKYTIKANLVCGESYSYVTAYLSENDTKVEETKTTVTNNGNSTVNSSTKVSSTQTKTTNSCGASCTPTVSTEVKQNISINTNKNNSSSNNSSTNNSSSTNNNTIPKRTYIVSYDKNGGTCNYNSVYVNEGDYVSNPGNCRKSGYSFKGWYLDGKAYDFNTPITRNIKLVAKYTKNSSYNSSNNDSIDTDFNTFVYTMGWYPKGTDEFVISHTLRLPKSEIRDIERKEDIEITDIRIKEIEFYDSITSTYQAQKYRDLHEDTFLYNGDTDWHSKNNSQYSLATIKENDVKFDDYMSRYKDIDDAEYEGFDVTWRANDVYRQCETSFTVNGTGNNCNYGIIYKVTWEFDYEY